MDQNSGKKENFSSPINDYITGSIVNSIPSYECHSETLKNLKQQQQQKEAQSLQDQFPPQQNYVPQPGQGVDLHDINGAYQQLVTQVPEIANNPALLKALQVLTMSSQQNFGYGGQPFEPPIMNFQKSPQYPTLNSGYFGAQTKSYDADYQSMYESTASGIGYSTSQTPSKPFNLL
jgi:hypothetical protein